MGPAGPFGLYLAPTPLFYATLPSYLPSFSLSLFSLVRLLSPLVAVLRHGQILKFGNVTPGPPDESSQARLYSGGPRLKRLRRRLINSSSSRSPWRFFSEESRDRDRAKPNITLVPPFFYCASPFFYISPLSVSLEETKSGKSISRNSRRNFSSKSEGDCRKRSIR